MAALLSAIVCYFVTPPHSCCVQRVAQLFVVYGRLALCCSATQPCSLTPCSVAALKTKTKKRGFPFYMEAFYPGIGDV